MSFSGQSHASPALPLGDPHSSSLLSSESVYETAAKLLFMCVRWAKGIPSFVQLSQSDQAALLEQAWAGIFVLSMAQWTVNVDDGTHCLAILRIITTVMVL